MAGVGGDCVHAVLASVEREDVITELVVPEVAVEPVAKLLRLALLVGGEFVVAPELAGEPSGAQPGVVGVALDFAGCDRSLGGAALGELDRVVGVLPAVVREPLGGAALVFEIAVAVSSRSPCSSIQVRAARAFGSSLRTKAASPLQRSYSSSRIRKSWVASWVPCRD